MSEKEAINKLIDIMDKEECKTIIAEFGKQVPGLSEDDCEDLQKVKDALKKYNKSLGERGRKTKKFRDGMKRLIEEEEGVKPLTKWEKVKKWFLELPIWSIR